MIDWLSRCLSRKRSYPVFRYGDDGKKLKILIIILTLISSFWKKNKIQMVTGQSRDPWPYWSFFYGNLYYWLIFYNVIRCHSVPFRKSMSFSGGHSGWPLYLLCMCCVLPIIMMTFDKYLSSIKTEKIFRSRLSHRIFVWFVSMKQKIQFVLRSGNNRKPKE